MTELFAPAPEDMKIGELYRVMADKHQEGAIKLEKASSDQTVILDLPKGLYRVLQVEALLLDETIEQSCLGRLKEIMESYLDSDGFEVMLQQTYKEGMVTQ